MNKYTFKLILILSNIFATVPYLHVHEYKVRYDAAVKELSLLAKELMDYYAKYGVLPGGGADGGLDATDVEDIIKNLVVGNAPADCDTFEEVNNLLDDVLYFSDDPNTPPTH